MNRPESRRRRSRPAALWTALVLAGALLVFGNPLTSAPAIAFLIRRRAMTGGGRGERRRVRQPLLAERLRAERGSLLIEVMFGAVLVVMASIAVLGGLDGSLGTAGRNKAQSVASSLAEQDHERMRSFKLAALSNLRETRTVNVAGVPYTVVSRADWVRDSSGVVSCTNDTTQAEYLRITSSVSSNSIKRRPVVADSLLSPPVGAFGPGQGTAAILVKDRDGNPVPGVAVALNGPETHNDTTNELGCAVFGYIATGTYTATLSTAGYVLPDGTATATGKVSVVGEQTSLTQFDYDRAARIDVSFVSGEPSPRTISWSSATVGNAKLPSPGARFFTVASPAPTVTAGGLFPFADGYGVYAGNCAGANPETYVADYFDDYPESHVQTDPGQTYTATARLPVVDLVIKNSSGALLSNARVQLSVTPPDASCAVHRYSSATGNGTNAQGRLPEAALPFGNYSVCADDGARRKTTLSLLPNTNPNGSGPYEIVLPSSQSATGCW